MKEIVSSEAMLIIGLGNKERKYEKTRHNAGHLFADFLNCFSGEKGIKTNCFMNQSGKEVGRILEKEAGSWKVEARKEARSSKLDKTNPASSIKHLSPASSIEPLASGFVIVHDDMDIPLGKFKISFGVSASGHKGVLSIIEELGTRDFWRIRIGVAPHHYNHHEQKAEDFVLNDFNLEELEELQRVFERIVKNPIFKGT